MLRCRRQCLTSQPFVTRLKCLGYIDPEAVFVAADEEEKKVGVIAVEVGKKQHECEADLAKAEPALVAAQAALDTLNKVSPSPFPGNLAVVLWSSLR